MPFRLGTLLCLSDAARAGTIPVVKVVVIGGGVIGYSVAHALAGRVADVQVVDMRGPGCGATQASAGMLAPFIEGHDQTLLRLGVDSLSLYDAFVRTLERATGRGIEYSRRGTLQSARTPERAEELVRDEKRLAALGVERTLLSPAAALDMERALAPDTLAALVIPTHGYVHVGTLMAALVDAVTRAGVCSTVDRAVGLDPVGRGWRVRCLRQSFSADVVVIAAGSWSGQFGLDAVPVRPVRGQCLEVATASPPLGRVVWGEGCYLVPWQNGSTLVGATVEDVGFDESPTPAAIRSLLAAAAGVLPSLAGTDVRAVRVGLRPVTPDELPLVGWCASSPGVCLATGHYRNGILLAPLTARLVADLILDADSEDCRWARDALAPSRVELQ